MCTRQVEHDNSDVYSDTATTTAAARPPAQPLHVRRGHCWVEDWVEDRLSVTAADRWHARWSCADVLMC